MRATIVLALVASLAAALPAAADGGHNGRRGHDLRFGRTQLASASASVQSKGSTVNIVQNGNQNGVAVVGKSGGTTNITQNGNNNSLTVIQVTVAGRSAAKLPKRGRY